MLFLKNNRGVAGGAEAGVGFAGLFKPRRAQRIYIIKNTQETAEQRKDQSTFGLVPTYFSSLLGIFPYRG